MVTCQPPGATRKGVSTAESWRAVQRVLTGGLYPPTPRTPRAEGLLVVLLAATVAVFRVPLGQIDSIWAEDGVVFLRQAEESAALSPVFRPYSGYLHVVPRLVAELASWLPLTLASYVFSIAAALVVGTAAGSVWVFGRAHLPSPWLRGGLSAAVALVPAGGLEAVDNVANSHWFLVFAAFWALLARRTSAWGQVVPAVIVALAALSDPLAIVLLPLALGRLLLPRRDWWVGASYVSAMIVQLLVVFSAERTTGGRQAAVDIAFGYSMRVVSTSLVGNGTTERLVAAGGRGLIWAFAGSVAVALAAAVLLTGRRRVLIVTAAVASVGLFGVESLFALNVQYPPAGKAATDLYFGSRYTIVPALLLLSALAVAAEGIAERLAGRWRMVVLVGALAPIALVAVADYRADDGPRASAPDWSGSVERAVRDCTAAPPDQVELLPIAPTEPWAVELRCAMLTGDRARPSP